tara:strand:- start:209 stop:334 length:126 start_codon:yes stop_codon:yes gene_type:complete
LKISCNKNRKWVVVDKNGKVVIISREKNIALGYARWRAKHE